MKHLKFAVIDYKCPDKVRIVAVVCVDEILGKYRIDAARADDVLPLPGANLETIVQAMGHQCDTGTLGDDVVIIIGQEERDKLKWRFSS